jgi:Tfp pilus assembly protein PilO
MQVVDEIKRVLLQRFGLVLGVTLVLVTTLVQAPQLWALETSRRDALRNKAKMRAADEARPSLDQIAQWERSVPAATIAEPSQFLVNLESVAMQSGCELGNTGDSQPVEVEKADSLATIDTNVQVKGTYENLLKFLRQLRAEPRLLAVVQTNVSVTDHPKLQADLTIRRYVRRTSGFTGAHQ